MWQDQDLPDAVIFDLDGTLIDSADDVIRCLTETCAAKGLTLVGQLSRACIGPPLPDMLQKLLPKLPAKILHDVVQDFRERYARSGFPTTHLFPGVQQLLAFLQEKNVICFIATNKPRHLTEMLLTRLGITNAFTAWQCIGDYNINTKSGLLRTLSAEHDLRAGYCVVIGDGTSDIDAANQTGMRSIAHLGGYGARDALLACHPSETVENMEGVMPLLLGHPNAQQTFRGSL